MNPQNLFLNKDKDMMMNYQDALNTVGDVYIAQDVNDKGVKQYNSISIDNFMDLIQEDLNLYEIIKHDRPHKMYVDLDCKYNSVRKSFEGKEDSEIKAEIVSVIEGFIEDFKEANFTSMDDWKVNVLDASNKIKFSFHFCIDIKFKNFEESQTLHKRFVQFCDDNYGGDEEYLNMNCYIDKSVYTKNRLLRTWNQSKYGQDRPLKIYSGSTDPKDHLITYFNDPSTPSITIPSGWLKSNFLKTAQLNRVKKQLPLEKNYNEDTELQWLVEKTQHKTKIYTDWIQWVWACLGAGISPELIHEFSYNGCPEKYNESSTNDIINQYLREKSKMGIHTLREWAAENGHEIQREVDILSKPLSIIREDHITWIDLVKKYHQKQFPSIQEVIYAIRDDVGQVISMIQGKGTLFTVYSNDDNPYDLSKCLCHLGLLYEVVDEKEGIKIKGTTLQDLMIKYPTDFPLYNKLVFKPRDHGLKKYERNTFTGFQAREIEVGMDLLSESKELKILLFHIFHVLANGNEEHYLYIMTWFARIIKTPWKPTDIFLLLQGDQGSGKTIIAEFLVKYIFGRQLSLSTSGISSLTSRFNGAVKSKLFVCCNELTMVDASKTSFNAAFDTMKNLITDRLIQIELKGFEHIQIENYCNFMGTTNHLFTAKLEKGDRRYACFTVSDKYIKNYEYFDRLGEVLNEETGNIFYTYLLNYPEDKMVDLRKIPQTELRTQLIHNSKNNVERFCADLCEGVIDSRPARLAHEYTPREIMVDGKIFNDDLYTVYIDWCAKNGESSFSKNIMGRMLDPSCVKDKGRETVNGKQKRWVKFKINN